MRAKHNAQRLGLILTLLIATLLGYGASRVARTPESSVAVDTTDPFLLEFGIVREGEVIQHLFQVPNRSAFDVIVERFHSTCGCTVVGMENKAIPAGTSEGMAITLNTTGKSGEITQPVSVQLSDGITLNYTLHGFVAGAKLVPIDFGTVLQSADVERITVFSWPPGQDIEIQGLTYDETKLKLSFKKVKRSFHIAVGIKNDAPYGLIRETVKIRTNDLLVPERSLKVSGLVQYPIAFAPEQVALGRVRLGVPSIGTVRIYSPYGKPLEINQVENQQGLSVSWSEERKSESELNLIVTLQSEENREYYKSVLRVVANSGGAERTFDVEVYGVGSDSDAGKS